MRLKSLEIQGFKSFPDKTRLAFDSGITAVVGPNGSGKSNIADAVRWVLGEQSTKTLRSNKMEDVIFGGTQTRKPMGYVHVAITLDNTGRVLPVEDDDVTVSRRLYRSGDSEYRLNGSMVRLKDIHEMLMDTGLGRDGYSIIGQGRISEIVAAKPVGRREIFEEAAGISKYRYRKEDAEKKLLQSEENLLRLRDILSELEERVGPLREQSEKAREFLKLSEEKKSLEISLWMTMISKLKVQISEQQDKVFLSKNDYERLEDEAQAVEAQINDAFDRSNQLLSQAESLRATVKELETELAQGESEILVLQNDISHNEISVERIDQELLTADSSSGDLAERIEKKRETIMQSEKELGYLESKIASSEEKISEQRMLAAKISNEIESLTVRQNSVQDAINKAELEKAAGAGVIEESIKRLEQLAESSGAYDVTVDEAGQNIGECEKQITEQDEKIKSIQNSAQGYGLKRKSRAAKLDELNQKIKGLNEKANQKKQRAKLLEEMEAAMEGFGGSVKYILRESKKGSLNGVIGAVSSLIDTPDEYALAIETALGAAMQNIVVADEETAKRAIRMLQNAKEGRATFLPLTTVKGGGGLNTGDLKKHEGFIGVASELVHADNRFKGVINQLLGRIAVVGTLDEAVAVARSAGYKFRIVTLDGQVSNAGGSFTGGSSGKSSGVLGRRHEIEKLRGEANKFLQDAEKLMPECKASAEELAKLDAYIQGAQAEEQTAREEKLRLEFSLETLKKNFEQAKTNRDLAAKELAQLTDRLEKLRGSNADSERVMSELAVQLAEIKEKIEDTTKRGDSIAIGIDTAAAELAELKMALISGQKDNEQLLQDSIHIQELIDSAETRLEQLKAERDGYLSSNGEIRKKIEDISSQKESLTGEIEENNARIKKLMQSRTELEGAMTGLRGQEKELASRREDVSRELVRLEERKSSLQSDYDNILAKLWDEYELTRSKAAELVVPLESADKANRRLGMIRGKIKSLGTVNVEAVEEYEKVSKRYEFLTAQVADVEQAKAQLVKLIGELTQEMRDIFLTNFTKIAANFSTIFVQLFGGGKAELTLTQEDDVLDSGVEIFVQPPGKIIKNLSLLSGGEQSFVAIAIYFAILKVRPAPFCILDEIEAALDDINVVRYATYLRQMSRKTQFISITHRRGTMEEADVLYGVTMQDEGVSKLLELNIGEVDEKLGIKD
ncbi:MAG: chromosome segregation protein SMC [Oscillospiraceae bacterium]|nr:chromosome segregation protein SMC [Oscillospiraceae bacterium]